MYRKLKFWQYFIKLTGATSTTQEFYNPIILDIESKYGNGNLNFDNGWDSSKAVICTWHQHKKDYQIISFSKLLYFISQSAKFMWYTYCWIHCHASSCFSLMKKCRWYLPPPLPISLMCSVVRALIIACLVLMWNTRKLLLPLHVPFSLTRLPLISVLLNRA